MRRICFLAVWSVLLFIANSFLPMPESSCHAATLQPGVPFNTNLPATSYASIALEVPEGATRLTVTTSNGSGDLDLYLTQGSPPPDGLARISDLDAAANILSDGPTANESITLTPNTVPPLVPSTWWVTTLNLNSVTTSFTLTATLEVAPVAEPALPVPGGQQSWVYPPLALAVGSIKADAALPLGVGPVADGGENANIHVKFEKFASAVDLYLGLSLPAIDPNHIYLLQPDGSLVAHTSGIRPWKSGFVGPLDSTLFGEIPVSLLPAGVCNLALLVTPAGRFDRYYLWLTSFAVPAGASNVPDGSAGYFNGSLVVPNSTIIYQGQEYQGSAPIPPDTLVGIVRDGQTYLYHTALGTAPLSKETTRRAVGRFVVGPPSGEAQAQASPAGLAPSSDLTLKVSSSKTLMTGVILNRLADKVVKTTNDQRRWAAIKGTDGTGPVFLPPVSRYVDNNLIRWIGTGLKISDALFNSSNGHQVSISLNSDSLVLQTYGATWRPLPFFIEGINEIGGIVASILGGAPTPTTGLPIDGLELRNQQDKALSEALDEIDLAYMLFEGIKLFAATGDVTEGIEPFVNLACNLAMTIMHAWRNGDAGTPHVVSGLKTLLEDLVNDLPTLGINLVSGGALGIFTLVDAIATLDYMVEGVVLHDADVLGRWAYDEIRLEPEGVDSCVVGEWTWVNDNNCSGSKDNMFEHSRYLGIHADGSATILGDTGTWKLLGNTLEVEVYLEGYGNHHLVGTVTNECRKISGEYSVGGTPKGCWYAEKK